MVIDALYSRDGLLPATAAIFDVVGMQSRAEFDVLELEHGSTRDDIQFCASDITQKQKRTGAKKGETARHVGYEAEDQLE